jgi:hypothetical protein
MRGSVGDHTDMKLVITSVGFCRDLGNRHLLSEQMYGHESPLSVINGKLSKRIC